jgi:hypothetical protein
MSEELGGGPDLDPARADTLASARRWRIASTIAGGFSGLLFPLVSCFMLITVGVGMFLFPILLPGFIVGLLCAMRAKRIESTVGEYMPSTKTAVVMNAIGLGAAGFFSLIAGCIWGTMYFGH